jgi:type IV pilus assembly protein PilM
MNAAGLDFSDNRARLVCLKETKKGIEVSHFEQRPIPKDVVHMGRIEKEEVLVGVLKEMRKTSPVSFLRVTIPESQGYSFTVQLQATSHKEVRNSIELILEENIPLSLADSIFDYTILSQEMEKVTVQVVAISRVLQESYYRVVTNAGFIPVGFELEGHAIARAIIPHADMDPCMIVDLGQSKTGVAVVANKQIFFTATIDFGGEQLTTMIMKALNISYEEAEQIKKTHGFSFGGEDDKVYESMIGTLATLRDEINNYYVYWNNKKNQILPVPQIMKIMLCGGGSNLINIDEYLKAGLRIPVTKANPWVNMFSFDDIVPVISREDALGYTTAIGITLADIYQ